MNKIKSKKMTIVQVLPALNSGGVERGTLEISKYLVSKKHRSIVISQGGRMKEKLVLEGGEHIEEDWKLIIGRADLCEFLSHFVFTFGIDVGVISILYIETKYYNPHSHHSHHSPPSPPQPQGGASCFLSSEMEKNIGLQA